MSAVAGRGARRRLVAPAAATAAVVGSVLTGVNQWDVLLGAEPPAPLAWLDAMVNFAVPFLVSLYSRWATRRGGGASGCPAPTALGRCGARRGA